MKDALVYRPPPPPPTSRRVYVLPTELVERIHQFGFENDHASEVSAVRELLLVGLQTLERNRP